MSTVGKKYRYLRIYIRILKLHVPYTLPLERFFYISDLI